MAAAARPRKNNGRFIEWREVVERIAALMWLRGFASGYSDKAINGRPPLAEANAVQLHCSKSSAS